MNKFYVIDLFSGCGGSAWGFREAGFVIKGFVEIDGIARTSFHENFPKATEAIPGDITLLRGRKLNDFLKKLNIDKEKTIILACPPCQGFSTARRRNQRILDSRNMLIFDFVRLIKKIRPIAFVMENVPGLAKGIGHSIFEEAMLMLSDMGYNMTDPKVLEVVNYGVPQKRKRLVIIGTRAKNLKLVLPEPTHQNPNSHNQKLPPWETVRHAISNLPFISAGEKNNADPLHISANLSKINLTRLKYTPHNGGNRMSWPLRLWLKCHKKLKKLKIEGYKDIYGRMWWDAPSSTITGGCAMITKGRFGHPEQNRAISLREAARLQTFPDNFIFTGTFGKIAEQIGNAVPPLFAERIANSLMMQLGKRERIKQK